ncbi:hypothetical protein TPCCA_0353a [Treponema paraluiscuniculi Cuniculi A]|uniref:Uncharacterized protein n=2 Tax=Treponema paraluiscuniculi TaxID=53435 RepID=F7XSG6_TREPU|nr:hypothetical protein TPCCA_0353a [Treponema paraluiscuniculi Cuniculi A]WKC72224.1 hypothetical protein TPLL2_0353a [Treponema paraluiscuniculi]
MQNIHLCPLRVSFPLKKVQHVHPRRKCNAHVYTALQNKTAYRKNQTVVLRTKVSCTIRARLILPPCENIFTPSPTVGPIHCPHGAKLLP